VGAFIARTINWFLVVFGLATYATLRFAIDINLLTPVTISSADPRVTQ
jgi:hypothetical protein